MNRQNTMKSVNTLLFAVLIYGTLLVYVQCGQHQHCCQPEQRFNPYDVCNQSLLLKQNTVGLCLAVFFGNRYAMKYFSKKQGNPNMLHTLSQCYWLPSVDCPRPIAGCFRRSIAKGRCKKKGNPNSPYPFLVV